MPDLDPPKRIAVNSLPPGIQKALEGNESLSAVILCLFRQGMPGPLEGKAESPGKLDYLLQHLGEEKIALIMTIEREFEDDEEYIQALLEDLTELKPLELRIIRDDDSLTTLTHFLTIIDRLSETIAGRRRAQSNEIKVRGSIKTINSKKKEYSKETQISYLEKHFGEEKMAELMPYTVDDIDFRESIINILSSLPEAQLKTLCNASTPLILRLFASHLKDIKNNSFLYFLSLRTTSLELSNSHAKLFTEEEPPIACLIQLLTHEKAALSLRNISKLSIKEIAKLITNIRYHDHIKKMLPSISESKLEEQFRTQIEDINYPEVLNGLNAVPSRKILRQKPRSLKKAIGYGFGAGISAAAGASLMTAIISSILSSSATPIDTNTLIFAGVACLIVAAISIVLTTYCAKKSHHFSQKESSIFLGQHKKAGQKLSHLLKDMERHVRPEY